LPKQKIRRLLNKTLEWRMATSNESSQNMSLPTWDLETDVVIAGYGGAGAVAGIEAHDAGAEVIILESTEKGGGNTLVSFGGFLCPTNVEDAITYITGLYDLSLSEKDEGLIRVFAEESVKNIDWVQGLGLGVKVHSYGGAGYPQVPGAESMKKYIIHGREKGATAFAKHLFGLLRYAVEERRGIKVLTHTPAKRLVTNPKGEVIGVIAASEEREIAIRVKRGVVLATGGYAANLKMLQNYVKGFPIYNIGHSGNKGDGIYMAQKVGAGLWHMNGVSCAFGLKVPEFESAFGMMFSHPSHIYVDKFGKRFVNETNIENHAGLLVVDNYDSHSLKYPRIPFHAVFDEQLRLNGKLSAMAALGSAGVAYAWSKDNSAEIEKGWISKADTLEALANKIGIEPSSLVKSVSQWNQAVADGNDAQFGRKIKSQDPAGKIETPPFYAVKLHPCLINTQGGPRRNIKAQVLDAFGDPIQRLYSAGELGSMWGLIYQGSGNIAECMVFGRIAGRNVAAEKVWN
jgi:succinate dehydrogenase/fumarate reductase flavoprotein subunit